MWPQAVPSHAGLPGQPAPPAPPAAAAPSWQACLRAEWRLALALTFVYVVTLAIFPGALAEDAHSAALGDWYPILLMTLFNFSDLLGKNAPLPPQPPPGGAPARHARLLRFSLARALFLPLCVGATRLGAPVAVLALLCVLLGATNG
jgi:equilibrative nucleoside transporter 1/2/3